MSSAIIVGQGGSGSGGSGASNPSVGLTGSPAPTSATEMGIIVGGNLVGVSASNPVPISGSVTATNPSVGTDGAAAPTSSTQVGASDGTNLQPLQVDASKNLKTIVNAALPAGTNVIGHVIADSGSTTAVTQATGTNLHTVVDSGTITAVTAITNPLPAGTNVIGHVIADSGSTTAVTQATAANLNATVVGTKTDNNAAPGATNIGALVAVANAVSPTRTEGDQVLLSTDLNAGQRTMAANIPESTAAWTSATGGNTALTLTPVLGYNTVVVTLNQTTTITGGVVTFEASDTAAGTNWYPVIAQTQGNSLGLAATTYTLVASTNQSFQIPITGYAAFRVRLSTVISGSGTVNIGIQASAAPFTALTVSLGGAGNITVGAKSTTNTAAIADNVASVSQFAGFNGTGVPLYISEAVYGGAFSGAADATRSGWSKMRTPTVFKTASVSAATTGNSAVWTPGSGNKFRLLAFQITAQGLAATASAVVTVSFQDSASGMPVGSYDVDVPVVASVVSGVTQVSGAWVSLGAFGILSAAANNVLNFNISAAGAGTVGTYRVTVAGTEE